MFLPKFVLKGNLQAPPGPGVHGAGVTCAPRGAQGQRRHMHTSHVFYATRGSSVLQLKAPAAPENEGPALVTPLLNQIQAQRKPAPCFTANRSLRFACTVFPADGGRAGRPASAGGTCPQMQQVPAHELHGGSGSTSAGMCTTKDGHRRFGAALAPRLQPG